MDTGFLEALSKLHDSGSEFVIVGGVAAALHGGSRVTFDLDIVPLLDSVSWPATVELLWSLGARPRIPETLERIRDPEQVRTWRGEKGMLALNFRTPDGSTEIDLLVSESDHYDELKARAVNLTIHGRSYAVASIEDLIRMKTQAGRSQDFFDIAQLQSIRERSGRS